MHNRLRRWLKYTSPPEVSSHHVHPPHAKWSFYSPGLLISGLIPLHSATVPTLPTISLTQLQEARQEYVNLMWSGQWTEGAAAAGHLTWPTGLVVVLICKRNRSRFGQWIINGHILKRPHHKRSNRSHWVPFLWLWIFATHILWCCYYSCCLWPACSVRIVVLILILWIDQWSLVYPKDGQGPSTSWVRINKSVNPTEGNQNNLTPNRKESKKASRTKSSLIPDEVVDGFSHSPYIPIDPLIHIIIVSCCCCVLLVYFVTQKVKIEQDIFQGLLKSVWNLKSAYLITEHFIGLVCQEKRMIRNGFIVVILVLYYTQIDSGMIIIIISPPNKRRRRSTVRIKSFMGLIMRPKHGI